MQSTTFVLKPNVYAALQEQMHRSFGSLVLGHDKAESREHSIIVINKHHDDKSGESKSFQKVIGYVISGKDEPEQGQHQKQLVTDALFTSLFPPKNC